MKNPASSSLCRARGVSMPNIVARRGTRLPPCTCSTKRAEHGRVGVHARRFPRDEEQAAEAVKFTG